MERGNLHNSDDKKILKNYVYLVENLDSSVLRNYCVQNFIFDDDSISKIKKEEERGRKEGTETMLQLLRHAGQGAYAKFITCLQQANYGQVVNKLEDTEIDHQRNRIHKSVRINREKSKLFSAGWNNQNDDVIFVELYPGYPHYGMLTIRRSWRLFDLEDEITKATGAYATYITCIIRSNGDRILYHHKSNDGQKDKCLSNYHVQNGDHILYFPHRQHTVFQQWSNIYSI